MGSSNSRCLVTERAASSLQPSSINPTIKNIAVVPSRLEIPTSKSAAGSTIAMPQPKVRNTSHVGSGLRSRRAKNQNQNRAGARARVKSAAKFIKLKRSLAYFLTRFLGKLLFMVLRWLAVLLAIGAYLLLRPSIAPWLLWVGVLGFGVWFLYHTPPKITVRRRLETMRTFTKDPVAVTLEVQVAAFVPTLLTLSENVPLTLIPDRQQGLSGLFWGRSQHKLEYRVRPNLRGEFVYPDLSLSWSDPFGLWQRFVKISADSQKLLVYPGLHALELPDLVRPLLADGPKAKMFGLEDTLSTRGVRDYVPGDDVRRVHWKQTARFGQTDGRYSRLVVREYERVAATGVHVHLDLSATGRSGEIFLESACRLAASLLRHAHDAGLRVSVSSALDQETSGSSFVALERSLAFLATIKLEPNAPLLVPIPEAGTNLILLTHTAPTALMSEAIKARARAARVLFIAMPEGFYLEPGESGRTVHHAPPDEVRDLMRRAGVLEETGVRVVVLRGDESVLKLGL